MCGVSVIISRTNIQDSLYSLTTKINKMLLAVNHRGPDGNGIYINNKVALGHNVLNIQSPTAKQPLEKNDCIITFNGEIYNYEELIKDLQEKGVKFEFQNEAELIIEAYLFWGNGFENKLNGMWSFVIYNKMADKVYVSRDRYGEKPLYYAEINNEIYFFSEIRQIKELGINLSLNANTTIDYLLSASVDQDQNTFYNEVFKVSPGGYIEYSFRDNSMFFGKYYNFEHINIQNDLDFDSAKLKFNELFTNSIKRRLSGAQPVAGLLSGGLDSSIISLYASQYQENFEVFYARNSEFAFDEIKNVKSTTEYLDLKLNILEINESNFISGIFKTITDQEYPFANSSLVMQNMILNQASKKGYKVVLDGQGSDELLLGYLKFAHFYICENKTFSFQNFISYKEKNSISFIHLLMSSLFFRSTTLYQARNKINRRVLTDQSGDLKLSSTYLQKQYRSYRNDLLQSQKMELESLYLPSLLRYGDKNAMAYGIENRSIFLDHELVEFCLSLPLNYKIQNGWTKYILRSVLDQKLPNSVVWSKKKIGFTGLSEIYQNTDFLDMTQVWIKESEFLNSSFRYMPPNPGNELLWRMFNVAVWEKQNFQH